ncbi:MAG TPA: hypothetical protein VHI71_05915 [Actinomycetota bacterium]|nr:hypothetical protein [Actinomycetota bacterium]
MKKKALLIGALASALSLFAGVAQADFAPKFELQLSDLKVGANPSFDIHLEFAETDEEIRNFKMTIPKGFAIAGDDDIPDESTIPGQPARNGADIGGGTIQIAAGPDCRPGPEGGIPVKQNVTINAEIYERSRTDDEVDAGVHAVWFLDLEPLNRVRLRVTGSPETGWVVEGAPDPSDNTCNPLVVDLTIEGQTEDGTPVITNPTKPGKAKFMAEIESQDSAAVAVFKPVFKITK